MKVNNENHFYKIETEEREKEKLESQTDYLLYIFAGIQNLKAQLNR